MKIPISRSISPIEELHAGFARFKNNLSSDTRSGVDHAKSLSESQSPYAVVVTCSDSRVIPELIFGAGIGDLFVIRTAGNILSRFDIGSIEYAVKHLNTNTLVIMGHTHCGAIGAARINDSFESPCIRSLVNRIREDWGKKEQDCEIVVRDHVSNVAKHLVLDSSIIRTGFEDGNLKLVGCVYDISTIDLEWVSLDKNNICNG